MKYRIFLGMFLTLTIALNGCSTLENKIVLTINNYSNFQNIEHVEYGRILISENLKRGESKTITIERGPYYYIYFYLNNNRYRISSPIENTLNSDYIDFTFYDSTIEEAIFIGR